MKKLRRVKFDNLYGNIKEMDQVFLDKLNKNSCVFTIGCALQEKKVLNKAHFLFYSTTRVSVNPPPSENYCDTQVLLPLLP